MVRKAASFAMVGAVNTVIDAGVFFLALKTVTDSLIAANLMAWFVAVTCSYVMNSFFTFAAESGGQLRLRDYLRFLATGVVGAVANTTVLVVAAQFLPVWAAKTLAIGVSFLVNFTLSNFVVFRKRPPISSDCHPGRSEAESRDPGTPSAPLSSWPGLTRPSISKKSSED